MVVCCAHSNVEGKHEKRAHPTGFKSNTRKKIQKYVAKNDFANFKKEMLDSGYEEETVGVTKERFKLRKEFLEMTIKK